MVISASRLSPNSFCKVPLADQKIQPIEGYIYSIASSPDGRFLAVGTSEKKVSLFDFQEEKVRDLTGHLSHVFALAFSHDSNYLVSAGHDRTARVWDVHTGKGAVTLPSHPDEIYGVAFAPSSNKFVTACLDGRSRLYELVPASVKSLPGPPSEMEESIRKWMQENPGVPHPLEGALLTGRYSNWVVALEYLNDQMLLSASKDGPINISDTTTFSPLRSIDAHAGFSGGGVSVNHQTKRLAIVEGVMQNRVEVWNLANEKEEPFSVPTGDCKAESLSLRKDGQRLAICCADGSVRIFDLNLNTFSHNLLGASASVLQITYSDNGKLISAGYADGTVIVWDATKGQRWCSFSGHNKYITALAFYDSDRKLATASADQTMRLWDVGSKTRLKTIRASAVEIVKSNNGRWLATGGVDNVVRIGDTKNGDEWVAFRGHAGVVRALAFSPDMQVLATSGEDNEIRFWDFAEFERLVDANPQQLLKDAEQKAGLRVDGFSLALASK